MKSIGQQFEAFYREIFTDLTVSPEESGEIKKKLLDVNPPPDKLVWLRASAFRIGTEFLTDKKESNIALLRCVNAVVHAIETTCMIPTVEDQNDDFEESRVEELIREVYDDLKVDREESIQLSTFFKENNRPPKDKLIWTRASTFRLGVGSLSEDKKNNIDLFKCINNIVHAIETTCMKPKPYELKIKMPETTVESVGLEASITDAAQHIWDLDENRLSPNVDYVINVQGGKKAYWQDDKAQDPLFTSVKTSELRRPTYKAFIALLDNYTAETGVAESVSYKERKENWAFLRAIMQTAPMQFCHKYCVKNGKNVPIDPEDFIKLLNKIWFELYSRSGGKRDSSGFEHVFVGEIKNGKVSGFHNWIYYYLEEKKGNVDYRGYIKPKSYSDAPTNDDDQVLTLQFKWKGVLKNVGTSFIGVSPEFEMALYTMCFLVGKEENIIELDTGSDIFKLKCKVFTYSNGKIGTSFVETLEHSD